MSNSLIELEIFKNNNSNLYQSFYQEKSNILNLSKISKSKFAAHYHFLCKICNRVPIIRFYKKDKIIYICECIGSPRELKIKDIFSHLLYSKNIEIEEEKLKCDFHPDEKYNIYCFKCKKNKCSKCASIDCIDHKDKIKYLTMDKNINNKCRYIHEKIKEKNHNYIDDNFCEFELDNENDDDISEHKFIAEETNTNFNQIDSVCNLINTESKASNKDQYFFIQKENSNIINNNEKEEIINIMNNNNNDELYDNECCYLDIFSIVIDDFQNYPNFNHFENISNIEQFIILSSGDFYELNLIYEFEEENIQNNSIELFGEVFVNNNYENCFLIINEKTIKLSRYINLSDIFDNFNLITNWPLILDVKLIIKKTKSSFDLSFMFYEISTISSKTIFNNLNNIKITKMNHMFYNCWLLKQIPDISEINTSNVTDMSYMFCNCSSLTQLPDLSKWNTKNVVDISHMFQNCELLINPPDISMWKTGNIKEIDDVFEGCTLLEEKIQKNNFQFTIIHNCLKNAGHICQLSCPFIFFLLLCLLILGIIFEPVYISFHLDKLNKGITNPIKTFDLIKYTNISYITEILKITNSTKIQEINENKEDFINNNINFTYINGNVKFETSQKVLKINNIIHSIVLFIKIILIYFICSKEKFIFIKERIILYLTLQLIFSLISLVFEIFNYFYIGTLLNSLYNFLDKINELFRIDIPQIYKDDIDRINSLQKSGEINFLVSIVFILFILCECKKKIQEKIKVNFKTYKDYLVNQNNVIK